jgi:hypothetical protein
MIGVEPDWDLPPNNEPAISTTPNGPAKPNGIDPEPTRIIKPEPAKPKPNGAAATSGDAWPELIDIGATERLPPFPTRLLPAPFADFVGDIADRMQVPAAYARVPVIVAAATMIGREFRVMPKRHDDWTERACIWGLLIGLSGTRKTPPMEAAMRPLVKMQTEMWERYRTEHATWQQRAKTEADPGPEPKLETVTTSETTVEALVGMMAEVRGIVLYRDELSGFHEAMNKYRTRGGDDRQFYIQCWSGGSYRVDRVKGTIFVDDLYLNIIGTIQPEVIRAVLRNGDTDGLTARYQLMVYPDLPDKFDVVDRQPNHQARKEVEARLREIRATTAFGGGGTLRFSGEAYAIFNRWLLNHENRPERRAGDAFGTHLSKYPGLFARLALVLHFMQRCATNEIAGDTAERHAR